MFLEKLVRLLWMVSTSEFSTATDCRELETTLSRNESKVAVKFFILETLLIFIGRIVGKLSSNNHVE